MKKRVPLTLFAVVLSLLLVAGSSSSVWADGTETLGPAGIPIASGTGIVAAGTGLVSQPGTITIDVPGAVQQVLLYWEGFMRGNVPGDDTIRVNGAEITGTLIGGPTFFFTGAYSSAYRADITGLGLVSAGTNTLTVSGLENNANNGAGILVVFDDGSGTATIDVRDGLDLAFINFPEPRKSTVAQTFDFIPTSVDRTATLSMFFSSVTDSEAGVANRPTSIEISVGGTTTVLSNALFSSDGPEWDTLTVEVDVPAGASSLTVQAFSRDDLNTGRLPASFTWIGAGLAVPPPPSMEAPGTGTPGYWKNHPDAWPVDSITIGGVTYTTAQAIELLLTPPKGDITYVMFDALVAAKLNVAAGNDSSCVADTIAAADAWMATYGPVGSGVSAGGPNSPWKVGEPLSETLDDYNNGNLCAPSRDALE